MSGQDLEEAKRDKKFDEELAEIIKEIAGSDESASEEMTEELVEIIKRNVNPRMCTLAETWEKETDEKRI